MVDVGEKTCDVLSPLYWPVIDELKPIKVSNMVFEYVNLEDLMN